MDIDTSSNDENIENTKIARFGEDFSNKHEFSTKIADLYKTELEEILQDILKYPQEENISLMTSGVKMILSNMYGEEVLQNDKMLKVLEKEETKIKKEYQSFHKVISSFWDSYEKKNNAKTTFFLSNFRKHCSNTQELALHSCNHKGKFLEVKQNNKTLYVVCMGCKATFFPEMFQCYCSSCNLEYYSSHLPPDEDQELQIATWEHYHCEQLVNQTMKCVKCGEVIYLNLKTQMLNCLNRDCKFIGKPLNIEWVCSLCKKNFRSNAVVYNPLEIKRIKKVIQQTLLIKHKAHPSKVPCCKVNIFFTDFYHKSECKGVLYVGEFDNKVIVVCEKCTAINYFERFIWSCPKCGKKFKDTTTLTAIKRSINERKIKKGYRNNSPLFRQKEEYSPSPIRKRIRSVYDPVEGQKLKEKMSHYYRASSKEEKKHNVNDNDNENDDNDNEIRMRNKKERKEEREGNENWYRGSNWQMRKKENKEEEDKKEDKKHNFGIVLRRISEENIEKAPSRREEKRSSFNDRKKDDKIRDNAPIVQKLEDIHIVHSGIKRDSNVHVVLRDKDKDKDIDKDKDKEKKNSKEVDKKQDKKDDKKDKPDYKKSKKKVEFANIEGEQYDVPSKEDIYDEEEKNRFIREEIEELNKIINQNTTEEEKQSNLREMNKIEKMLSSLLCRTKIKIFNMDDFARKKRLGEGSYGTIFRAEHKKTKENFALKQLIANEINEVETFEKEFEIVYSCIHPNIMKIYGMCIKILDITTFSINVLMEMADSDWEKEIRKRVDARKYYSETELKSILGQLVSALSFMQMNKISHRDIKPQNVLVFSDGSYKVADFGEAKEVKIAKQLNTVRGTELYMSPILYGGLKEDKENLRHDAFKSDVFSLGICFIYAAALNFQIIYDTREIYDMKKLEMELRKNLKSRYSEQFIQVLVKLLEIEEKKRFDFLELKDYLNENYLNEKI